MRDDPIEAQLVSRITCCVHQRIAPTAIKHIRELGVHPVFEQGARCVRHHVYRRKWPFPGKATTLHDSPMSVFRFTILKEDADQVLRSLTAATGMSTPGRGMVFAQDLEEYRVSGKVEPLPQREAPSLPEEPLFHSDLTLLTAIVSTSGKGEQLAQIALDLGVGTPLISLATGAGIRDRLGLLRITISPEKEVIQLLVPAQDERSILRLLIEEGRINRPGGGYIYQTPVCSGLIDTLTRIGRQEHAASMEQVIAVIDDLKGSARWRKRAAGLDDLMSNNVHCIRHPQKEITFLCAEGKAAGFVDEALKAGAPGATTALVSRLDPAKDGESAALERGVLHVPAAIAPRIVKTLLDATQPVDGDIFRVQAIASPMSFSYQQSH